MKAFIVHVLNLLDPVAERMFVFTNPLVCFVYKRETMIGCFYIPFVSVGR
jgi:hypothetical protein